LRATLKIGEAQCASTHLRSSWICGIKGGHYTAGCRAQAGSQCGRATLSSIPGYVRGLGQDARPPVCPSMCACVRACVRAYVRTCVCVRARCTQKERAHPQPGRGRVQGAQPAVRVCMRQGAAACVTVHACRRARAEGLRAHPIPSPPCMRHSSMATEKPSAGVTAGREGGAERAGGDNPLRAASSPSSITSLRPLSWCSSMVAMVQPSISWCGGTLRRPGRKPPSLHGRRLAPPAIFSTGVSTSRSSKVFGEAAHQRAEREARSPPSGEPLGLTFSAPVPALAYPPRLPPCPPGCPGEQNC